MQHDGSIALHLSVGADTHSLAPVPGAYSTLYDDYKRERERCSTLDVATNSGSVGSACTGVVYDGGPDSRLERRHARDHSELGCSPPSCSDRRPHSHRYLDRLALAWTPARARL